MSEPGAVDPSDLLAACRSGSTLNPELLHEILGHFIRQNRSRMMDAASRPRCRQPLAAGADAAHAVKGSAALIRRQDGSRFWHTSSRLDASWRRPACCGRACTRFSEEFDAVVHSAQHRASRSARRAARSGLAHDHRSRTPDRAAAAPRSACGPWQSARRDRRRPSPRSRSARRCGRSRGPAARWRSPCASRRGHP